MEVDPSKTTVQDVARMAREEAAKAREPIVDPKPQEKPAEAGEKAKPAAIALKSVPVKKSETTEHGVIYGIGAGTNVDLDDESLVQKSMITMAHDFCSAAARTFKANHSETIECKLVESALGRPVLKSGVVLKAGDGIPEGDEVIGFDTLAEPTHWYLGVQPQDPEVLAAAKAGAIAGFSWSGLVNKSEVV